MIPKTILAKYQKPIDDINTLIVNCNKQLANKFSIKEEDLYSYSLFFKITNGYKASIKLLKNGLVIESGYIVRTITESLFILKYMSINVADAIKRLNQNLEYEQNRMKRIISKNDIYNDLYKDAKKKGFDTNYKNNKDFNNTSIYEWAKISDLEFIYSRSYNVLCTDSHTNIKSIEKHIKVADNCITFSNANDDNDFDRIIIVLLYIITATIESMGNIFNLENKDDLDKLQEIIDAITKLN